MAWAGRAALPLAALCLLLVHLGMPSFVYLRATALAGLAGWEAKHRQGCVDHLADASSAVGLEHPSVMPGAGRRPASLQLPTERGNQPL